MDEIERIGSHSPETHKKQTPTDVSLQQFLALEPDTIQLSTSQSEMLDKVEKEGVPILKLPWPIALGFLRSYEEEPVSTEKPFIELSTSMWDLYLEYLHKEEDRRRAYLKSPEYQKLLELKSPAYHYYILREKTLRTHLINGATKYADHPDHRTSAIGYGAFMLAAISLPAIAATESITQMPIPAAELAEVLTPALQDPTLLVVNLFVQMAALPTAAQTAMLGLRKEDQREDSAKKNAHNYARAILNLLGKGVTKNTQVDGVLQAMVRGLEGADDSAILAKIMLIAPALAQLYNTGVGWNAGAEFLAILDKGGIPDFEGHGPEEATLAGLLRGYLGMLPPKLRQKTKDALHNYFSSNPSMKELENPLIVLSRAFQTESGGPLQA